MYTSIQFLVLLVVVPLDITYGFYVRNNNAAPAKADASADSRNDEWGVFQNRLGLSPEKGKIELNPISMHNNLLTLRSVCFNL